MPSPSSDWTARQPHAGGWLGLGCGLALDGARQERLPHRGPAFREYCNASESFHPPVGAVEACAVGRGNDVGVPYYEALHPPRRAHWIIDWKVVPKWIDHATDLWRGRQELRRAYEAAHGADPAKWPVQRPGVLLGSHAAIYRAWGTGPVWVEEMGVAELDAELDLGCRGLGGVRCPLSEWCRRRWGLLRPR
jgi:hypothetical protein